MNFGEFLKQIRTQKNIATAKDHYTTLGGDKKLGISLRHYQQIEAGKHPPSEKLLQVIFEKLPARDRKAAVVAYFRSVLGESEGKELLTFIENHLTPAVETEKKSIWETNRRLMIYSESQLDFLTLNPDALRFHKRVLLFDRASKKDADIKASQLNELVDHDLIEIKGNEIRPSRALYRLPHYDNSAPRAVAKATDYILKHIDLFISREGAPKQELSYAVQMVTPAVAERVLDQMRTFKKWVQSLAYQDAEPGAQPFVFVSFGKQLGEKDL